MKKLIYATISAGILIVGALENPAHSSSNRCRDVADVFEFIMTVRQSGMPISDFMDSIPRGDQPSIQDAIVLAYTRPMVNGIDEKRIVIEQFRIDAELRCYQLGINRQ